MAKPKRRIKAAKISLISLVPAGANRVTSLFKSRHREEDVVEMAAVAKMDSQGYLTSLVYVPDTVDTDGDTADAEVIKEMAHGFVANMEGNGIDVLHDGEPVGNDRAHVCETFIVQKDDPRFAGVTNDADEPIDPTGSWGVVIKIDDPELRSRYATGEWVGVSMFGSAIVEPLSKSNPPQEIEMDETKMAELLKTFGKDLSENIVTGLSKALEPKDEPKDEPVAKTPQVEFEGDPTSLEDLEKHAEKVMLASLDLSKAEDIAKWRDHLAKKQTAAPADPNAAKIAELEKQLAKLRKAPTADGEPSDPAPTGLAANLAKGRERAERLKKAGVIR